MNKLNEALGCDSTQPDVSIHQTEGQTQDNGRLSAGNGPICTVRDVTAECGECEGER